ncbi:MAG: hypothetical protein Q8P28_06470 [Deltaproteobacteria bacterium]|nr:hypothetical protein [Deltaproteobacteria bacterium]
MNKAQREPDTGLTVDLNYPEHKHPHGIEDTPPDTFQIWACDECRHIFTDEEIRQDAENNQWGHACKAHPCRKGQRCESHLEPYMPLIGGKK